MDVAKIKAFLGSLTLEKILPALLIAVVGVFAIRALLKLFDKALSRSKTDHNLHGFLRSLMRILLYFILALIVASRFGIDVTSLVALLSVVSLALSLAVQDSLSNIAGGIMVLTARPFTVGDFVSVGDISGYIVEVGLVYTRIRTLDNKVIFVPNSDVSSSRIVNYTLEDKRRIDLKFSADYKCPVEDVKQALRDAASLPAVLADEPLFVQVSSYEANDISYELRVWVKTDDYWPTYYAITENVKKIFDERGLEMSYPHTVVHLEREEKA